MLFGAADDEWLPGITGKFFFIIATVLVLDHKTVIPEQGINFLWKKLSHLEGQHRFLVAPFLSKKLPKMIDLGGCIVSYLFRNKNLKASFGIFVLTHRIAMT
jgi:hypothetical protein